MSRLQELYKKKLKTILEVTGMFLGSIVITFNNVLTDTWLFNLTIDKLLMVIGLFGGVSLSFKIPEINKEIEDAYDVENIENIENTSNTIDSSMLSLDDLLNKRTKKEVEPIKTNLTDIYEVNKEIVEDKGISLKRTK